jgi:hypothetical protein
MVRLTTISPTDSAFDHAPAHRIRSIHVSTLGCWSFVAASEITWDTSRSWTGRLLRPQAFDAPRDGDAWHDGFVND